jgi:hypothetical protein
MTEPFVSLSLIAAILRELVLESADRRQQAGIDPRLDVFLFRTVTVPVSVPPCPSLIV